jgi:hypothetical protein
LLLQAIARLLLLGLTWLLQPAHDRAIALTLLWLRLLVTLGQRAISTHLFLIRDKWATEFGFQFFHLGFSLFSSDDNLDNSLDDFL